MELFIAIRESTKNAQNNKQKLPGNIPRFTKWTSCFLSRSDPCFWTKIFVLSHGENGSLAYTYGIMIPLDTLKGNYKIADTAQQFAQLWILIWTLPGLGWRSVWTLLEVLTLLTLSSLTCSQINCKEEDVNGSQDSFPRFRPDLHFKLPRRMKTAGEISKFNFLCLFLLPSPASPWVFGP